MPLVEAKGRKGGQEWHSCNVNNAFQLLIKAKVVVVVVLIKNTGEAFVNPLCAIASQQL